MKKIYVIDCDQSSKALEEVRKSLTNEDNEIVCVKSIEDIPLEDRFN